MANMTESEAMELAVSETRDHRRENAQIRELLFEAAGAGDDAQAHCCHVALGDREPGFGGQQWPASREDARRACLEAIAEARAADDDSAV